MPIGESPYSDICTKVIESAKAKGAIVVVIDGQHGTDVVCELPPDLMANAPEILEQIAVQLREGLKEAVT